MADRETILDRLRAAIARAKARAQSKEERPDRRVESFLPEEPELSEDMPRETIRERITKAVRPHVQRGGKLAAMGVGLLFLGLFSIFAAGDPAYNEETGYHDLENDGSEERAVGYSMLGLGVALMIAGGLVGAKSDRELEESIELMLSMREVYPNVPADLDVKKVKRLLAVLPEILLHLSPSDKAVLDGFMQGDKKLLEDEKWRNVVAGIMAEHLKKHPEDLELVIDAYRGVVHFEYVQKQQNSTPDRGSR